MQYQLQLREGTKEVAIRVTADSGIENDAVMQIVRRVRKPVTAFGGMDSKGLMWGWIFVPISKQEVALELKSGR